MIEACASAMKGALRMDRTTTMATATMRLTRTPPHGSVGHGEGMRGPPGM